MACRFCLSLGGFSLLFRSLLVEPRGFDAGGGPLVEPVQVLPRGGLGFDRELVLLGWARVADEPETALEGEPRPSPHVPVTALEDPNLDNLRGGGSEQEADLVLGLLNYAADYKTEAKATGEHEAPPVTLLEVGVLKSRYGDVGRWAGLAFERRFGLIRDPTSTEENELAVETKSAGRLVAEHYDVQRIKEAERTKREEAKLERARLQAETARLKAEQAKPKPTKKPAPPSEAAS